MPRLTWSTYAPREINLAREAFALYRKRRFVAKHTNQNGTMIVREFHSSLSPLDFEPAPTSFNRLLEETDPWES